MTTMAVSVVFWTWSTTLFRVLGRARERAADRGAAAITGDPLALASALRTIDDEMTALPDADLRSLDGGVAPLYVSPLSVPVFTDEEAVLSSKELFSRSHPPTEERVAHLQDLAADLETRGPVQPGPS
jgi:heat shock protein HtpX